MKITKAMQKTVSYILTQFMFADTLEEALDIWNNVYEQYELCTDPFTGCPCTPDEYNKNSLEYQRQIMMERYGHCDGLD